METIKLMKSVLKLKSHKLSTLNLETLEFMNIDVDVVKAIWKIGVRKENNFTVIDYLQYSYLTGRNYNKQLTPITNENKLINNVWNGPNQRLSEYYYKSLKFDSFTPETYLSKYFKSQLITLKETVLPVEYNREISYISPQYKDFIDNKSWLKRSQLEKNIIQDRYTFENLKRKIENQELLLQDIKSNKNFEIDSEAFLR